MTVRPKSEHEELAGKMKSEIAADAPKLALGLFPKVPPGMAQLSGPAYLRHVQSHWPDPIYRQELLDRIGPKHFMVVAREVFGVNKGEAEMIARSIPPSQLPPGMVMGAQPPGMEPILPAPPPEVVQQTALASQLPPGPVPGMGMPVPGLPPQMGVPPQ